jgi:hypothetical protein
MTAEQRARREYLTKAFDEQIWPKLCAGATDFGREFNPIIDLLKEAFHETARNQRKKLLLLDGTVTRT